MIGGDEAFFPAADGVPVLLTVEKLLHIKPNRSPFVPFIPELLADPFEVWVDFEQHEATGRVELKKKYIKRIPAEETKSGGMGIYMVAQIVKGEITGWTFISAEKQNYIRNIRKGKLVWHK